MKSLLKADQSGIDENIRRQHIERGVTTHNNGDHGIRLWLVHSYVKQAIGDIIVDNNNFLLAPFYPLYPFYQRRITWIYYDTHR